MSFLFAFLLLISMFGHTIYQLFSGYEFPYDFVRVLVADLVAFCFWFFFFF